ncbi:hypothetical protein DPMN_046492 [Dreissena polymorpha]|uniref:Uncharacterized protein n=1 Tax=Dreissena polymorpha TaxID=45954 RepID=A0A9D4D6W2_DREPO|nr:hypothetical protein DPMN_046492 [Dreissena polymorpha]
MAAAIGNKCVFCFQVIKGTNYRNLTSNESLNDFGIILKQINLEETGNACNVCVNKLNRLRSFDKKIECLEIEKSELLQTIKSLPGAVAKSKGGNVTPHGSKKVKRALESSPSGLTPKSKRTLFRTPRKPTVFATSTTGEKSLKVDASTSTCTNTLPTRRKFDVKVMITRRNTFPSFF